MQINKLFFDLPLNSDDAKILHIDINSCFATIEQQANPFLRGKPVAVVAHDYSRGCILAASIEAKRYGIKTGMLLEEGKKMYPNLVSLKPDPDKYRDVHKKFHKIIEDYSEDFYPKSIDEFVINLSDSPHLSSPCGRRPTPFEIAQEIKNRIKAEIGEWISVSAGIGTNRFWAKTAANFKKPDGLTLMNKSSAFDIYSNMNLLDIHGINIRNKLRLNKVGIYSPVEFANADIEKLKSAFQSVNANYWYERLRGYEIDSTEFNRKSFGNTYSMPGGPSSLEKLSPILMKLIFKSSMRLRKKGFYTQGVHVSLRYKEHPFWHKSKTLPYPIFKTSDIYKHAFDLLKQSPRKPVANLAVTCFNLINRPSSQLDLFSNIEKDIRITKAMDEINDRYNKYTIFPAKMLTQVDKNPEAIGFGNVKEII